MRRYDLEASMGEITLDPNAWDERCVNTECTLHQLSPFLGKMKSTMANELISTYSEPSEAVLDPFSGSGTVPLEAASNNRNAIGIDRNPYSVLLSKAKVNPPDSENAAIRDANGYLEQIDPDPGELDEATPEWVREFFHPKTLSGISQLTKLLLENDEHFLMACLLGILHHQRPGFLSYPASNLKPYLRDEKFPRSEYPEKYEYREIEPRLISKIERAYRRFPDFDESIKREIWQGHTPNVLETKIEEYSVDTIITSPPYMNKLDYGRDNRLRLFFLGVNDYSELDGSAETEKAYRDFMDRFLTEARWVAKPNGKLVFVLGESQRSGSAVDTAEILVDMVNQDTYGLSVSEIIQDKVPIREINSMSSKTETILALDWGA